MAYPGQTIPKIRFSQKNGRPLPNFLVFMYLATSNPKYFMALLLCIEAGTDIGSVALAKNDRLLSLRESCESRQHAQNLAVYVEEILRENDLDAKDLDAVAVGMGPGSYTGLRICVSLAKGICYGAGIPLIAVGSLEALTRVALEDYEAGILNVDDISDAILLPMIDARRMEVYTQSTASSSMPRLTLYPGSKRRLSRPKVFSMNAVRGGRWCCSAAGQANAKSFFPRITCGWWRSLRRPGGWLNRPMKRSGTRNSKILPTSSPFI